MVLIQNAPARKLPGALSFSADRQRLSPFCVQTRDRSSFPIFFCSQSTFASRIMFSNPIVAARSASRNFRSPLTTNLVAGFVFSASDVFGSFIISAGPSFCCISLYMRHAFASFVLSSPLLIIWSIYSSRIFGSRSFVSWRSRCPQVPDVGNRHCHLRW